MGVCVWEEVFFPIALMFGLKIVWKCWLSFAWVSESMFEFEKECWSESGLRFVLVSEFERECW